MQLGQNAEAESTHARLATALTRGDHVVEFYENEEFLVDSVAQFLTPALAGGDAVIIVATREHRDKFEAALTARGLDVPGARRRARFVAIDAAETLATFMVEGTPDPAHFRTVVGGLIDRAAETGRGVRVYGEMVALLWEEGNILAAVALEGLWNELAESHPFSLLCAYPMESFNREEFTTAFRAVCQQHSAVIPSESYSKLSDPDDRLRTVALLQQETNAALSERIASRRKQDELEAALDQLRELDRLRNEFVAMVVHDLRTPATLISEFLRLLRDSWSELSEDEIQEFLTKALENGGRIERLVADILTMSRIDSRDFTYDLRAVDLGRVVERVVGEMSGATGRSIDFSRDARLPTVLTDEVRQVQILNNLLSNALKFSPETTTVSVSIADGGDRLTVNIRDEGVGIDPEHVGLLFRPFSRLPGPGERAVEGTGLGLYIAKALAEGQGGTISVVSVKGEGSTFSYTVPTATPSS